MRLLAPVLLVVPLLGVPDFSGASEGPPAVQPEARALLDEVAAAYRGLSGYGDHGVITIATTIDGERQVRTTPMALTLRRPDRIALDAGEARLIGDGTTLTTVLVPTRKYLVDPAPARVVPATVTEGPLGALLLGSPAGDLAEILLTLLLADDPTAALLDAGGGLRLGKDGEVGGQPGRVLVLDNGGAEVRIRIDPATKLVRRMELVAPEGALKGAPYDGRLGGLEIAWDAGEIRTNAPDPAAFTFEPPVDFTRVGGLEAGDDAGKAQDKPAPDAGAVDGADRPGGAVRAPR